MLATSQTLRKKSEKSLTQKNNDNSDDKHQHVVVSDHRNEPYIPTVSYNSSRYRMVLRMGYIRAKPAANRGILDFNSSLLDSLALNVLTRKNSLLGAPRRSVFSPARLS